MRVGKLRVAVVLWSIGVLACSTPAAPDSVPEVRGADSELATAVITLTNAERSRAGLAPLGASGRLMQAAQIHAEQMARYGRLAHVLSEAAYPGPADRLAAVGYAWQAWAENVAFGQRGAAEVVASWMASSGHRANILNASLTEIGAGQAPDANGRLYWVQVFARPAR